MHENSRADNAPAFRGSEQSIRQSVGFGPERSSSTTAWRRLALFAWRGHCEHAEFRPFREPVIVYHVGGAQSVPVRAGRFWGQHTHPGLITVIPPDTRVAWGIRGEVYSRTVHLGSRFFAGADDTRTQAAPALKFRCGFRDPMIAAAIEALENTLSSPSETGTLFADSVADTLALHLMSTCANNTPQTGPGGGLSRQTLTRCRERLHACIDTGVSLQQLADDVGLSRAYLADAFRRSTGLAPHQYLTRIRVEQGRRMLTDASLAIAEIALRCGFSSQSHFTTAFRKTYGMTPRRFRLDA